MTVTRIKNYNLFKEVPIAPLLVFRIIFGALMLFGTLRFVLKGWVYDLYILPKYHFTYYGFDWVKPLSAEWMYLPFTIIILSCIAIILGFKYRLAIVLFFISFTYVELIDKSYYLNHYYFVSLIAFLLIFLPANRAFAIDALTKNNSQTVYAWQIDILKFQLAIVYFFAGIAKINCDWLIHAQPLKTWLQAHHHIDIFGFLFQQEWLAYLFSWTGCIYDLIIVFLLLKSRFRKPAYILLVIFHLLTWYLFPIGIFPWVMIFATLIFFSPEFHLRILTFLRSVFKIKTQISQERPKTSLSNRRIVKIILIIYISLQILIPLRFLIYPGNLFWNEEGFRFSWRVMLMHKVGNATFYIEDRNTGNQIEVNNSKYLSKLQEDQMATQPDMILQYAQYLYQDYDGKKLHFGSLKYTMKDPKICANIYVSLNGRPSQLFVRDSIDLSQKEYDLCHRNWLEPYKK